MVKVPGAPRARSRSGMMLEWETTRMLSPAGRARRMAERATAVVLGGMVAGDSVSPDAALDRGVVLAHDMTLDHNVDAVDIQVLQDARVVRDDEHGTVAALAVGVHAVNATIQETISGIAVAKNFRQEATIYHDFQAINDLAYRVQLRRVAVFGSIFPLLNTVSGIGVAVIIYVGGLMAIRRNISVGDWYLFVQGLTIFFYPITSIASFWSQFQLGLAASERVFALVDADRSEADLGLTGLDVRPAVATLEDVFVMLSRSQTNHGNAKT